MTPETPRDPYAAQQAAKGGPLVRQGGGDAVSRPSTMSDHDDLCEALFAYEAEYALGGHTAHLYGALMDASARCGRPFGTLALGWSRRRVNAYRNMMGGAL